MQDRDPKNNLIELLQDAWSFESKLLELVEAQVRGCKDRASRRLYAQHARMTRIQRGRIEQRMKDLGSFPMCQAGWFTARLRRLSMEASVADSWRDEATQLLITSYGIKQVECSMYRSILDLAEATDDEATFALAKANLEEEDATARRLLYCIGMATRGKAAA